MKYKITIFFSIFYICGVFLFSASDVNAETNLIQNPSLEQESGGSPVFWGKGRWGTNTAVFNYPVQGVSGKAAEVSITSYTSGDAKWYPREVPVEAGASYIWSDQYKATRSSYVTLEYRMTGGGFRYLDIAFPASASSWTNTRAEFTVPSGAEAVRVFHLIKGVGSLTIDTMSLVKKETSTPPPQPPPPNSSGIVSFTFDDGWKSIYQNALPIFRDEGIKTTQYIITGRFDFPAYMTKEQVKAMHAEGHEIASHTRRHVDLRFVSSSTLTSEVSGSRQDLWNLSVGPVSTISYPFGGYNSTVITAVKNSGYKAARSSDSGFNSPSALNLYALKRQSVESNTSVATVKGWIDTANREGKWLILVFHRIDYDGTQYTTTPENLRSMMQYAKQSGIQILPLGQALTRLGY